MNSQISNSVLLRTIEECVHAFLKEQEENALLTNSVVPSWNDSGFPLFEPANDEYFALKHARVKLEVAIREHLVEPILGAMLASYGYKVEFFRTTSMLGFPINGVLGRRLPFNLTIERNGIKKAFCYTEIGGPRGYMGSEEGEPGNCLTRS